MVSVGQVEEELAKTYRSFSDFEIASLFAEIDSLTEDARSVLTNEIQRRGLSSAYLAKLHAKEFRREEKFDRREKIRRKGVASYLLFRGDGKWNVALLVVLLLIWMISILAHHR